LPLKSKEEDYKLKLINMEAKHDVKYENLEQGVTIWML